MVSKKAPIIKYVPNALVIFRMLVIPFLVLDAWDGATGKGFVIAFIVAFATDLIDGPIARRFDAVSDFGSKLDSYADVLLFGATLFCIPRVHYHVVEEFWIPILVVGTTQITSWVFSLIKFGRLTHYHSYLAKFWAFTIAVAVVALFGFNYAGVFFWLAIVCGIASNIEDMIMTFILPRWSCDVLTVCDALRLRKG